MSSIPRTMRGAMLLGPEQIEIRDVPIQRPAQGELLLRIQAATTCGTDVKVFRRGGHPRMLQVPALFGHEMAGTVAEVGRDVTQFQPDDAVVVANSAPCGACRACKTGRENLCDDLHYINGAFAEYLLVPARFVARNTHALPKGLGFSRAALTEPLACALHGINACELEKFEPDTEIAVYGAGPIGLLFVAALSMRGFRVLLADPNPARLAVGQLLGATCTLKIARGGVKIGRGDVKIARGEVKIARGEVNIGRGEVKIARGEVKIARGGVKIARGEVKIAGGEVKIARGEVTIARGAATQI